MASVRTFHVRTIHDGSNQEGSSSEKVRARPAGADSFHAGVFSSQNSRRPAAESQNPRRRRPQQLSGTRVQYFEYIDESTWYLPTSR